jgi:nuclear pore complex protein Nup107
VKSWLEVIAPANSRSIGAKRLSPSTKPTGTPFSQLATTSTQTNYQDPDAITRDGIKPDEYNQRVEHGLLQAVWEYIRRGQIQTAKEACEKAGEPWRAESISGGELYSVSTAFTDPQYDREEGPIGNKTRGLWKGTCYALAKEATTDIYERAIYGALCGDIQSVCNSPNCQDTWITIFLQLSNIDIRLIHNHRFSLSAQAGKIMHGSDTMHWWKVW